jgi:hypothetical protein
LCIYSTKGSLEKLRVESLWLSGEAIEWENKWNQKIPGSLPSGPGNLKKLPSLHILLCELHTSSNDKTSAIQLNRMPFCPDRCLAK